MRVQVLMIPGCGHGTLAVELVEDVVRRCSPGVDVETIQVATPEDAAKLEFPGSPTIRVNGLDVDPLPAANVGLG